MHRKVFSGTLLAAMSAWFVCNDGGSEAIAQARFQSNAPRYARLALDHNHSRVLSVAFDESRGTGKGYDLLYADVNFNGAFEDAEKLEAEILEREGKASLPSFPPIRLAVAYNSGAKDEAHWSIVFSREVPDTAVRVSSATLISLPTPSPMGRFGVYASMSIRRDSTRWRYFLNGSVTPSLASRAAPTWSIPHDLKLELTLKPDEQIEGNLGVGLSLNADENVLACYQAGMPVKAQVKIKNANGTVVHEAEGELDKFGFG